MTELNEKANELREKIKNESFTKVDGNFNLDLTKTRDIVYEAILYSRTSALDEVEEIELFNGDDGDAYELIYRLKEIISRIRSETSG